MPEPCWLENDNPYGRSYANKGQACDTYGTSDYVTAVVVLSICILILLGLGIGWIIRYSRKAAKFRRFWNQTVPVPRREDYELKQHRDPLIYQRDADGASVRTRPTSVMSRNDTREGEDLGGRSYSNTPYSEGGLGAIGSSLHPNRNQNPSLFSNDSSSAYGSPSDQTYNNPYSPPQPTQPWQNFPPPSASNINLHVPVGGGYGGDESRGFLDHENERDIGLPEMETYDPDPYRAQAYTGNRHVYDDPFAAPGRGNRF